MATQSHYREEIVVSLFLNYIKSSISSEIRGAILSGVTLPSLVEAFNPIKRVMDIMWPTSQSHFHLLFIFIEMKFYLLSFLCDVCNQVHEHIQ